MSAGKGDKLRIGADMKAYRESEIWKNMKKANETKCNCVNARTIAVQYELGHPQHYDGYSELMCFKCKQRVGRWSNRILSADEYEIRLGGRK